MQTITALYDHYSDASLAVADLEAAGLAHADISIVANKSARERVGSKATLEPAASGPEKGASVGAILAGGAGLLAGLGMMAIPGIGPVVAAGWLASTITGAAVGGAAGGLVGALTNSGVNPANADVYAEGVRRGGALVTVNANDGDVARVRDILKQRSWVDPESRAQEYRRTGWTRFDEKADPVLPGV